MTVNSEKPKIGLALGSGSSRGWAHIGIINALQEIGIEPDVISGCSIGSLVGAAYTVGNLEKLESWVASLSKLSTARFFEVNFSLRGFVNHDRFKNFLTEYVCADDIKIEDLNKIFATVSTELESGREKWFTRDLLIDGVCASIAMPGLFPPFQHRGSWMVDGALVNPVPVSVCRALGADVVIAVNLNSDVIGRRFDDEDFVEEKDDDQERGFLDSIRESAREYSSALFPNLNQKASVPGILDSIAGSINITQDRITRSRMAGDPPDVVLKPRLGHIGLLEFYRGSESIAEGYECVQRMLPELNFVLKGYH
ncbi:FIG00613342: Bacterial patatin-like phospholipase domain containing protein [hydrothermal vent metagenome]|uniref:FIG00613342: Bacterial patatin-like phospholipase domain containing protein n=1 Tax=hydrothermal vent metagenome TaxID=652676 RepID=A0A3B1AZ19_9ZZZZ